jgi:uncharacterized protein YdhG (YjbR/CyaY superfamily)
MNMFKETGSQTPEEYIKSITDEKRREEVRRVHEFIRREVPELEPHIQSGMIGYGSEHYKTKSGSEGDWPVILLANRKNYIAVYSSCIEEGKYIAEKYKDKIGKSDVGKSCMRFKKYEDINFDGLGEVIRESAKLAKEIGIYG